MNKILLVDDNPWEHVAQKLKSMFSLDGLQLETLNSADACAQLIDANERSPFDLFIIDVMMPPGKKYSREETHDGLITGLYLARDIREKYPLVPIILWSGTSLNTIKLLSIHMEKRLTKCVFVKKPFSGNNLVKLITAYFKNGRFPSSLGKRLWAGIVLRPSIGGLGIDVKQLLDG